MAKMKVHELAKELDVQSKDVLSLLQEKGYDVKTASSGVDEDAIEAAKKAFGKKNAPAAKPAEAVKEAPAKSAEATKPASEAPKTAPAEAPKAAPAEAPKKKKSIIIINNASGPKNNGGNGNRPGGNRPQQNNSPISRPLIKPTGKYVSPSTLPHPEEEKEEVKPAVTAPVEEVKAPVTVAETAPAPKEATPAREDRPQNREDRRPQNGNRNEGPRANAQGQNGNRVFVNNGYQNRRDGQGGGYNRDGQNGGFRGNRDGQNGGYRGNRDGQNGGFNRDGQGGGFNRNNGQGGGFNRGGQGGGFNRDGQGGGFNRNNGQGGGFNRNNGQGGGFNRDNNRFFDKDAENSRQGGGFNRGGQRPGGPRPGGGDAPMMSSDKNRDSQRRLNQEKDKKNKKDYAYEEDKEMSMSKKAGRFIKPERKEEPEEEIKVIKVPETITIKDLADKMKIQPSAIVKKLFMKGQIVTVNQEIDFAEAEEIAIEYEIICEQEEKVDVIAELLKEDEEDPETLTSRPPVICVMGHVDHGKTSLLDAIRKTNVTEKEAGGITQAIGAYTVVVDGKTITFLDTPGHEAFTAMRMRGANATDIAILVVAADDGVMPQTIEAINHAKAAGVEIIVAVNKVDKPGANVDRVKQELTEYGLIAEDWGGSTVFAPVSAKTGQGIPELLEMILLSADILELKANKNRKARGMVIEAELDKGRGPVATVLVQKGTLHVGDFISAGASHGKVRAMVDDKGRRIKEATPSTPVEILGLDDVPNAGEIFIAHANDKEAKSYADTFIAQNKVKLLDETKVKSKMSLDDLFGQIQAGNLKELNLIVKADVQGSVEAVKESLLKLSNEEVVVKVIHSGVGAINESDVILASASNAIIIGFNVRPDAQAKSTGEREGVDIRLYKVIYQAIEDVQAAMKGMLDPVFEEKVIGHAEVRQIFKASAVGNIAGSYVLDGVFQRNCKVRISREGEQIFEGELASLKRFKDDVKEVKAGFECGLVFEGFDQMQELDIVEAYIMVEVPR